MRSFLDTDLLIYADASDQAAKQERALELIREHRLAGTGVVSTQVLQEYASVALRKLKLPAPLIRERLAFYARFDVLMTTPELITAALDLHVLRGLSFYDALIVQAAIVSGAAQLLSEDLQHGAVFAGLRITNPFQD